MAFRNATGEATYGHNVMDLVGEILETATTGHEQLLHALDTNAST